MRTVKNTLADLRVEAAISQMFDRASHDSATWARAEAGWPAGVERSPQEQADAAAEIYMPISRSGGELLYSLIRAIRPETVVEFGMSFGISTLYLASAVRDNGTGRVITTELSRDKVAAARRTFAETGLDDAITILEGDARQTLADLDSTVDFVLLDGWKDLYLPVLHLLEKRLKAGALIVADDVELPSVGAYLDYVRATENGYQSVTFPVEDGMEISCRL